jgi:cell division protein FtsL
MARRTATAAARAPAHARPARSRSRPRPARRASGPTKKRTRTKLRRAARPRVAALLDTLLYGRGWIGLVGVLLVGIVFFNVDLLQLNRSIATTTRHAATVKQQNARLRLEVARLASTERIQRTAADRGLVLPAPGDVRYLRANPSVDGLRAAKRVGKPRPQAAPAPTPAPAQAPVAQAPVAPTPVAPTPVAQAQPQQPAAPAAPSQPPAVSPTTGAPPPG